MILVYPPVAKPSEPPAGIAQLAGALKGHGIDCTILDANIESLLYMTGNAQRLTSSPSDRWTDRAFRNASKNYRSLKGWSTYQNIDRYKRAVIDLNRALEKSATRGTTPGLANYRHHELSPLRSADLIRASEKPEMNPFYSFFSERLLSLIQERSLSHIGFSMNYLSQALCTFAMIGFVRQNFPEIKIILGGGLVTSWTKRPTWGNPFTGLIDLLVSGPGEEPLLSVMGINMPEKKIFMPAYDSLPLNDYISPGFILPYSASSGCYWNRCSFCPERAEDNPYAPKPVDKVIDDLGSLISTTRPELLHLLDNAVSTALLKRLADSPPGVPWYGFARINSLLTDIDFCMALKESGCVMLKLGLESGDQGVLDSMEKGISLERASLVLKTLKRAGIATYIYLLFGTPPETLQNARNTLEFVVRHQNEIGFLNLALFNMPLSGPGINDYETISFYEGDLSLYSGFTHPGGWHRGEVRKFLQDEFRKQSAVSEILRRNPPIFTSNHAPFFAMNDG